MARNRSFFTSYNMSLVQDMLEPEGEHDWMDWAACKGQPMNLFSYPDMTNDVIDYEREKQAVDDIKQGIRICGDCPVSAECLESATEDDLRFTVRAGLWPKRVGMAPRGRPRNVNPEGLIITKFKKRDKEFSPEENAALDLRVSKGGACPSRHVINSRDCLVPKKNGAYIKALCRACIMDRNNEYKRRKRERATMVI